jgi:hypothetical protein
MSENYAQAIVRLEAENAKLRRDMNMYANTLRRERDEAVIDALREDNKRLRELSSLCRWMVESGMYSDYDIASAAAYPDREKSRLAYAAWRKDVESDIRNDC